MKTSLPPLKRFALRLAVRLAVPLAVLAAITAVAALRPGWLGKKPLSLSHPSSADRSQDAKSRGAGAVAGPGQVGDPPQADALFAAAIDRLSFGPSLTARLHQQVRHCGGEVFGVGAYWQESFDRGGRFKLELRTKTSHLRVVGDGAYVWRQAAIEEKYRITRIDLKQFARLTGVQTAQVQSPLDARVQDRRNVAPLSLGGLPQLLKSLAATYRFGEAKPAILSDVPVFELRGTLAGTRLPATGVSLTGAPPAPGKADERVAVPPPSQIPSHVIVSLGQDDRFPYRVVYDWKNASPEDHENGVPARVEILFFDVSQGPSIDTRHFDYSPPRDTGWEDVTADVATAAQPST